MIRVSLMMPPKALYLCIQNLIKGISLWNVINYTCSLYIVMKVKERERERERVCVRCLLTKEGLHVGIIG